MIVRINSKRKKRAGLRKIKKVIYIYAEYKINIDEGCEFDAKKVGYI